MANNIVTNLDSEVESTQMSLLGQGVVGKTRVKGFLEIWQQQALRDADIGWNDNRLLETYELLEAKFTRALVIQLKCVRLLMEAYEALYRDDRSPRSGVEFFLDVY